MFVQRLHHIDDVKRFHVERAQDFEDDVAHALRVVRARAGAVDVVDVETQDGAVVGNRLQVAEHLQQVRHDVVVGEHERADRLGAGAGSSARIQDIGEVRARPETSQEMTSLREATPTARSVHFFFKASGRERGAGSPSCCRFCSSDNAPTDPAQQHSITVHVC